MKIIRLLAPFAVMFFSATAVWGQLETLLTSNPGNLASARLQWTVSASGADSLVTDGNEVPTSGSLANASGNFSFIWTSEYDFDETTFAGTLSNVSGNKWGYNAGDDNLGPITPTDSSIRIDPGEAIRMAFDLSGLALDRGFVLQLDGMTIRNSNNSGDDSGGRFSMLDQSRATITQLTGNDEGQISASAGDGVLQVLNQIVQTGDEIAFWRQEGLGGQVRVAGFHFSIVPEPPAPTPVRDDLSLHRGRKVLVPVLANDLNLAELDRIEVVSAPSYGTTTLIAGGVLYEHAGAAAVEDSFTYRLVDQDGRASDPATVALTISSDVRIENGTLNVPPEPPVEGYAVENAFPGMSFFLPLSITSPPGETDRLFVCEKFGVVQLVSDVAGIPQKTAFFDVAALLSTRQNESLNVAGESGLLGLAFHPDYASNGYFYVFYSVDIAGQLHQRVSRFSVSADRNLADVASEQILIEQEDEAGNHNGGDLQFGPDGYLYVSVGDEGGANDQWDNSQRIDKDFFSGVLRIDVDKRNGNLEPNSHPSVITDGNGAAFYAVPADNPWVGATSFNGNSVVAAEVITEFYAVGLRNPWRIHFDPLTGDLYCADVGQNAREEVNLLQKGGNYGWGYFEGSLEGPDAPAPEGFQHASPIYEYSRGAGPMEGRSISGGVVYRGTKLANVTGKYVFGDYTSGNIWTLERQGEAVEVERIAGTSGPVAFGYDPSSGDVLIASINAGQVQRLVAGSPTNDFPATLTATGVFADLADLSPNPGILHYEPQLSFWSDHAFKERWFVIPNLIDTISYAEEAPWTFPAGMVWIKHFELELERGNPATRKRLETRLLVKNEEGAYGVSYRWNEDETEAYLAPSGGEDFSLEIDVAGEIQSQEWRIPGRNECITCHLPNAGHALSFNTRQLNLDYAMGGFEGNQIETLGEAGYLSGAPSDASALPRHIPPEETQASLEARARSYLAVNCAYCHQSGSANPGNWDASALLSLGETGLINGALSNDGGDSAKRLVVPGDVDLSVLWHRMGASAGFARMPPLATNVLDQAAIDLVRDWIDSELPQSYLPYADWRLANFGSLDSPEGEPSEDADGDTFTNQFEWLTRTDPNDGDDYWRLQVGTDGEDGLALTVDWILNRVTEIEVSSDLEEWIRLEHPANHGFPSAVSERKSILIPGTDLRIFYRSTVRE